MCLHVPFYFLCYDLFLACTSDRCASPHGSFTHGLRRRVGYFKLLLGRLFMNHRVTDTELSEYKPELCTDTQGASQTVDIGGIDQTFEPCGRNDLTPHCPLHLGQNMPIPKTTCWLLGEPQCHNHSLIYYCFSRKTEKPFFIYIYIYFHEVKVSLFCFVQFEGILR